jgi:hypothetical protein
MQLSVVVGSCWELRLNLLFTNLGCKRDNMNHTRLFYDCFCDFFLGNIHGIFLKNLWKNLFKNLNFSSYYFTKFYVTNLAKNVIFKKNQIYLQVLLLNKHYNVSWVFLLIFYSLD